MTGYRLFVLASLVLVSACAETLHAQSLTSPVTVTAAPGAPDARLSVVGPEAFVILDSTDSDPAKELPIVAFKLDLSGARRKIGVLAFQFDGDPVSGAGRWNIHTTQIVNGTSTDTFQLLGCGGRRLTVFPYATGPAYCAPEGWFHINGSQRVFGDLQVDGDLHSKTIAALEARIAALEARLSELGAIKK